MAEVLPFRGWVYNSRFSEEIHKLLTPPYDVISPEEQDYYHEIHPYNIIRLILGKKKRGDTDWDNQYTRAADCLQRWISDEILIRLKEPCFLLYSVRYDPLNGESQKIRWGFLCVVRIEEEDSEIIIPHERTFSAYKQDRLKLMKACNAQLSPIFGLYEDREDLIISSLKRGILDEPLFKFRYLDGTEHMIWEVEDREIIEYVIEMMKDKKIFIADGHHRYETARIYRNMMVARFGSKPKERVYNFVMFYLCNMYQEGLTILPAHRLIKSCPGFSLSRFFEDIKRYFSIKILSEGINHEKLPEILAEAGRDNTAFIFHFKGDKRFFLLTLKEGRREEMGDDLHPSLKRLDVLVLSRLIFQKVLGFSKGDLDDEKIFHYNNKILQCIKSVRDGHYDMVFMVNPTKIEHVKEVTSNSLIMPRKSTFFYPKVLTGIVINKINPYETIKISKS